jgi:hypothetical protein
VIDVGLRLVLLEKWTPNYILSRELDHVARVTESALQETLKIRAPQAAQKMLSLKKQSKNLDEKRDAMAKQQVQLVDALVNALGKDDAVAAGRKALFEAGKKLGMETRRRLGAGENTEDLVRAAKILYRVLGINFTVEWHTPTHATLTVDRCALAKDYSEVACFVLSATDEGVVEGLDGTLQMHFKDRITNGCSKCTAEITSKTREGI